MTAPGPIGGPWSGWVSRLPLRLSDRWRPGPEPARCSSMAAGVLVGNADWIAKI
jgi:hypothetical protein